MTLIDKGNMLLQALVRLQKEENEKLDFLKREFYDKKLSDFTGAISESDILVFQHFVCKQINGLNLSGANYQELHTMAIGLLNGLNETILNEQFKINEPDFFKVGIVVCERRANRYVLRKITRLLDNLDNTFSKQF